MFLLFPTTALLGAVVVFIPSEILSQDCSRVILSLSPPTLVAIPHVAAYKHSEHGNEKDKGVMVCVSHGYPLPTDWTWFKLQDGVQTVCNTLSARIP